MARLLHLNPFAPRLFALSAVDRARVRALIARTGSSVSERAVADYALLFSNPGHVAAALGMMAHWTLDRLRAELPALTPRLTLLAGARDGAVPPSEAEETARLAPRFEALRWDKAGHLLHEEQSEETAALAARIAVDAGLVAEKGSGAPTAST